MHKKISGKDFFTISLLVFIGSFILSNLILSYSFIYWPFATEVSYYALSYILVQLFISFLSAIITVIGFVFILLHYKKGKEISKKFKRNFVIFFIVLLLVFVYSLTQRFNPENFSAPEWGGLIFAILIFYFYLFFLPIFLPSISLLFLIFKFEFFLRIYKKKRLITVFLLLSLILSFIPFLYLTQTFIVSERIHNKSVENLNFQNCFKVRLADEKDECLFNVFFRTKNTDICEKIDNYHYFVKCISYSVYFTQNYKHCDKYDQRKTIYAQGDKRYCKELLTNPRLLKKYGYNESSFVE